MPELTKRKFQKREGSRYSEFITIDKPALRPLPNVKYEQADVKVKRVGDYYHLEYDGFYYSVSYTLHGQKVLLRATPTTIEIMNKNHERIAIHIRRYNVSEGRYSTILEHMPPNHQAVHQSRQYDGPKYRSWAKAIGPNTYFVVDTILKSGKVEEQGYRSCMGILQKALKVGNERVEAACERARILGSPTYTTVQNILKNGVLEVTPKKPKPTPDHENIRGSGYYQ